MNCRTNSVLNTLTIYCVNTGLVVLLQHTAVFVTVCTFTDFLFGDADGGLVRRLATHSHLRGFVCLHFEM